MSLIEAPHPQDTLEAPLLVKGYWCVAVFCCLPFDLPWNTSVSL